MRHVRPGRWRTKLVTGITPGDLAHKVDQLVATLPIWIEWGAPQVATFNAHSFYALVTWLTEEEF